ncbi:MAG: hypothetical protein KDI30_06055 [Pseudomonadales bacterium]|nr:hypothetical protein [Pseudomonadales bacterium]
MFYLFINDAFFYLPISLFIYAIVNEIAKRTVGKNVEVSGARHTIAIVSVALLSSGSAWGLAAFLGDSNLLPQSEAQNPLIIGGLPLVYSAVSTYITRVFPIRATPSHTAETSLGKPNKTATHKQVQFLVSSLAIALVLALYYIYSTKQPANYDECVIQNTPAAQTQAAVSAIRISCRNLFPRFTSQEARELFRDANPPTRN